MRSIFRKKIQTKSQTSHFSGGTRTEAFCSNCDNLFEITLGKILFFIENSRKINALALPQQLMKSLDSEVALYTIDSFSVKETKIKVEIHNLD